MPDFQPAHLARITGGEWHAVEPERIQGFCFDTRQIEPGDCFVALKSDARDGHDFVTDAAKKGASSAMTSRALDENMPQLVVEDTLSAMGAIAADVRSQFSKPVIGITGSCGKTSTKEMLRLLLGPSATHATAGNWNNRIGVPMTLFDLDPARHDFAVIEAGINQPGEMGLLGAMIQADLTVLTNIGPAHLELLGSLEGVADEKSRLAEMSQANAPIILPAEALQYPAFSKMKGRAIAVQFDAGAKCPEAKEVVTCRVEPSADGRTSRLWIDGRNYEVKSASAGIARNAALAIVAARTLGVATADLAERIRQWQPEDTRGRVVATEGRHYYIDCYNANPASMIDALQAFRHSAPEGLARCYVLGVMNELGGSAEKFHASVGEALRLRPQDRALFVGPETLTSAYRRGAEAGGMSAAQLKSAENIEGIESMVAEFQGALFLKGSRAYHLEKLLPESVS
ncbi:hypothetical protein DDZ13_04630 [Coraliomargarita sinensis]|uniref:UDP-N-acetylmuramoyl-tripeptide--D-alanyl-D-alanine ligase n=1 Tax=Coraliomargarita sinensis TaxID=2174842 RepID=A0A317ZN35_9BACT|nr:UDP-N-acetylmuramoyl-tripeptide--D-alanyl-D-alanine ligase [Coraliomargarita sinensis]PXA05249.1 hypothetical protein DDZ13_04630 [Coraliomargarita sinensis]